MLNWIKFISVFLIALTTVIAITVFYNANKPFDSTKAAAKEQHLNRVKSYLSNPSNRTMERSHS